MIKRVVNVMCVDEDTVKDKDAVKIELSAFSSCEHTRQLVQKYGTEFCDSESCNFQIFQKENSNSAILIGQSVTDDLQGVTGKIDHLKEKLGVVKASPRWGKHQPTVLVALLLSGLIGAALLIAGYCWKTQRNSNAKGMKLPDDSYQVDEENQGNTLVSVAPLTPPEPQEKPSINGESPEAVKTQTPAATNGHSTTKTPVADTEL
ncbi:hematopoietic progenitor cell antigen CD34 [Chanos chanos]|uniref:Hematopoietic progenitor cell antigen CD34 n=1 Tax=Chanos chanos TaxID=29144 RepID=A0A6J2V1Q0_CHACN|nr:hematopoietic progenitor cell antigen CD34-like [Chanos chanos]